MTRSIAFITICLYSFLAYGQYHPIPNDSDFEKLIKISDNVYNKAGLQPYHNSIIIYYGDLGCDDVLNDKVISKSFFNQGIKFGYHTKRKCLFKKEKYLAADIYYLDKNNQLLGYFDGYSIFPAIAANEDKMYPQIEKFIIYLHKNKFTNVFSLACALDVFKYYAINIEGKPVLLDEQIFRKGENPVIEIDKLE